MDLPAYAEWCPILDIKPGDWQLDETSWNKMRYFRDVGPALVRDPAAYTRVKWSWCEPSGKPRTDVVEVEWLSDVKVIIKRGVHIIEEVPA